MQICRTLAGYSYARADIVRRAMSKKKAAAMQAEREDFIIGCKNHGISTAQAEEIFGEMQSFAEYAFNKSHATAYGIVSYRTAYLKAHYPAEYFTALLASVLDNAGKVREYIADAERFGVSVLAPDINESGETFTTNGKEIRFGLMAIKNVGRNFAKSVIKNRSASKYVSFSDFVTRLADSELNKRTAEYLIKCGAFDSLGVHRSALMQCYESIIDSEHGRSRNNIQGQMDLFSGGGSVAVEYKYPDIEEYPLRELLLLEKESSGMYFSGHLIDGYEKHISSIKPDSISSIIEDADENGIDASLKYPDKAQVKIAGIISAKRTKVTRSGEVMAFLTVEDRYNDIEVIVFAKNYTKLSGILCEDSAVSVFGSLSREEGEAPKVILSDAIALKTDSEFSVQPKIDVEERLYIKVPGLSDGRINNIQRICALNRGRVKVVLYDEGTKKYSVMKDAFVNPSDKVISRLVTLFGQGNVILK